VNSTSAVSSTPSSTSFQKKNQSSFYASQSRQKNTSWNNAISSHMGKNLLRADTFLALGMLSVVGVMLVPLPSIVLDLLLSMSIAVSLVVFLFSLQIEKPLDFSAFPSLLLITTLFRLSLNVASTRLILLHGGESPEAAGEVIHAFGEFVVGGNVLVGFVMFVILVVINFVVITKGSGRIAEVAARFTLDAMPGKQMAIDADLAAGLITESEAKMRRSNIEHEADFFGSMDGAGKFVRGDAVAGLVITAINIVGGLLLGVAQKDMPFAEALKTYTSLTVGDGLVSQIPALMTSIAAGLVTTRAAAGGSLGETFKKQIFAASGPLAASSLVLLLLAVFPGMPHLSFLLLSGVLGFFALRTSQNESIQDPKEIEMELKKPEQERAQIESSLPVELLEIEVGYDLVGLVDAAKPGNVITRIAHMRQQFASEYGVIIPPVHMKDNLKLKSSEYRILVLGAPVASSEMVYGKWLAIHPVQIPSGLLGKKTKEASFGLPCIWIDAEDKLRAEQLGCTVVDASTALATHLSEVIQNNLSYLVGRKELQEILDIHGRTMGKLIEDLIPSQCSLSQLLRVVRNLLSERISIRDMRTVLETVLDFISETKDPDILSEHVRARMGRSIVGKIAGPDGFVPALLLSPAVEGLFRRIQNPAPGSSVESYELSALVDAFEEVVPAVKSSKTLPSLVCASDIRKTVAAFSSKYLTGIQVVSVREIGTKEHLKTVAVIGQKINHLREKGA
jgi:flagellar biosynthesis protein FlhA